MKISQIKQKLKSLEIISFRLPDGTMVPGHFHVTEVGRINKHFIDCGGTVRHEEVSGFQLWDAHDYDHRLHPEKLIRIIELSERILGLEDLEIEVEYQASTIGKYGLDFDGRTFLLTSKHTDCLAKDHCGSDQARPKIRLSDLQKEQVSCCSPNTTCC